MKKVNNAAAISKELLELTQSGGEMGALIQQVDWGKSAVGPFRGWPQSLKTALSICLGSKFPMFVWWGKELTVFYNDAYIPFTGLRHPEYLGRSAREQWAEIWDELGPLTEQVLTTGRATWAESMRLFMTRKGFLEETYFTFSYSPIRDESGGVGGIINPCQETTERILGERRLKTLHNLGSQETKSILEVGQHAAQVLSVNPYDIPFALIYLTNPDGKAATLIGNSGIQVATAASPTTIGLLSGTPDIWRLRSTNASKTPVRIDGLRTQLAQELPKNPFEELPDSAYVLPLMSTSLQTPMGFLILGISPRLSFDSLYQEFFGLLGGQIATHIGNVRTLEEEKKRVQALAEIDTAKTAFFSNVSHEFRTPLTLMLGPIEDMLLNTREPLSPALRSELGVVHRNALRLLKLVNTLLDFSRLEANRVQVSFEPVDLASYTSFLASAFDTAVQRASMKLHVNCPPISEKIYVDKDMWEKIVLNLVSNAFKYTLAGEISVSLNSKKDNVELRVQDTGTGIPKDELAKIFQRFHRVQGAQGRTHEGTGIGLALVKELVDLHKGSIGVESILGTGSTFTVTIPKGFAHLPQERVTHEQKTSSASLNKHEAFASEAIRWLPDSPIDVTKTEAKASENSNGISKKQVLLADDNADMREYVGKILAQHYDVVTVANGQEAFDAIVKRRPDLIISDIMMPVMDGIELLKKIREDASLKTLPVLLLSARAGQEAKASGIEVGADDYLTKPFSVLELLARVQTQLNLAEMRTQLLQELEATNRELEAFSYAVSHDLKAPLRGIAGFVQILEEDHKKELSDEAAGYFDRIRKATSRMAGMIDALLELSRCSRGDLQMTEVDLTELSRQIISDLTAAEPSRKVEIKVQDGIKAYGDPRMLRVVLQNLIQNAWKYSKNATPSVIELSKSNEHQEPEIPNTVTFFVKDNGAGFDMAHADRLFTAFQRLHSSAEFEGNGIGLATAQRVIHRHGGQIWAKSKVGEGAQFFFALPARRQ